MEYEQKCHFVRCLHIACQVTYMLLVEQTLQRRFDNENMLSYIVCFMTISSFVDSFFLLALYTQVYTSK